MDEQKLVNPPQMGFASDTDSYCNSDGRGGYENRAVPLTKLMTFHSCSWLLLHEFVKLQKDRLADVGSAGYLPDIELPKTTYGKARVVMTRPGKSAGLR